MKNVIRDRLRDSRDIIALLDSVPDIFHNIALAAELCVHALNSGGKLLFCGNGGSAAQAQHTAAELIGRFRKNRPPFAAIALTGDTATLSALGNDYGYDQVFARQVEGLGRAGDILIVFSTSGKSANVLNAINAAKAARIRVIGFTGNHADDFIMRGCSAIVSVPNLHRAKFSAALVQQAHLVLLHILCELIETHIHKGTYNASEEETGADEKA